MLLFFFGTLMDKDLLSLVLGRQVDENKIFNARVEGFVRHRAEGESFPFLRPEAGGIVKGTLVADLSEEDLSRLRFFEDEDEYQLFSLTVKNENGATIEAQVFMSTEELGDSGEVWDYENWLMHEKPISLLWTEEYMSYYGRMSVREVDAIWGEIKERATQKYLARQNA